LALTLARPTFARAAPTLVLAAFVGPPLTLA